MTMKLCRTCLSQSNELVSIHKTGFLETNINKMISMCIGLEISKWDKFSNQICKLCFNHLENAYKFRQLCWESNDYFMKSCNETYNLKEEPQDAQYIVDDIDSLELNEIVKVDYIKNEIASAEVDHKNTEELYILKTIHNEEAKACKMCNKQFSSVKAYRRHMRNHKDQEKKSEPIHNTTENVYKCYLCSESFNTLTIIKQHLSVAHNITYPPDTKTELEPHRSNMYNYDTDQKIVNHILIRRIKRQAKKVRDCYVCPESFFTLTKLKQHLYKSHNIIYNEDLIPAKAKTCKICNKQVESFQALRHHISRHTEPIPGVCDYCGKKFSTRQSLTMHIGTHTGEKPYKCGKCDFRSSYPRSLSIHQAIHSDERKFECDICQKTFKRLGILQTHKRIHFEEKPFVCFICHKAFKLKSTHRVHMKLHDDTKRLSCSHCDQKFVCNWHLKNHMKRHTT